MIEESGVVLAIEDGIAEVETIRTSSCSTCRARHGCGHHAIAQVSNSNRMLMKTLAPKSLQIGDKVVVGIPEDSLLSASIWMYAVPMLGLVMGATVPSLLTEQSVVNVLGALGGFFGGLWWARKKSFGMTENPDFYPRILRVETAVTQPLKFVPQS
ncbi:SoxR reducing system RseC family protein [Maribrevibacterium harenarium]|uniref:SoxR reducing system RseC family protein n=1 Tax=Maribrevibacterium harenarium TaxID=2589817 RepID=A0A501WXY1_9GAMM|nr:SoxR reducing system RseC family protein [Maribrevibacterium harenarium]TPE51841.1 SoxR reducing system RseC family protein [Maribrevibacterium harenarium]